MRYSKEHFENTGEKETAELYSKDNSKTYIERGKRNKYIVRETVVSLREEKGKLTK